MTDTTCSGCGKPMSVSPYRLTRSRRLFCSRECRERDGTTLGRPRPKGAPLVCPVCGSTFHRKPAERREVNYCSYACAAKGTGNLHPTPKGARRSPGTEFGTRPPHNRLPVGSVSIRRHKGDTERAWLKVAEPNVWRLRAVVVWEAANGPVPRGHVVHHRNRDSLDDRLENLTALDRATHLHEHRQD